MMPTMQFIVDNLYLVTVLFTVFILSIPVDMYFAQKFYLKAKKKTMKEVNEFLAQQTDKT